MKLCVPSYKRPRNILTKKIYKNLKVYVCESEYEEYKKHNEDIEIIAMPKGVQGNISRVRNYILDNEFKEKDRCVIIDDDFSGVYYHENEKKYFMSEEKLSWFIENAFEMSRALGVKMWGINLLSGNMEYRIYSPLSMKSPVLAPFTAHFKNDLRYDERIPLKEDYDFFIQHMNEFKKVLRFNKFFYLCKQSNMVGGCASMRNREEEERQLVLLEKKWGKGIIKRDMKKHDYNPVIKIPIKGI